MDDPFALLASMPEDAIPAPGPLPAGSRMALRANGMFVGREAEFRKLARLLKAGGAVAIGQVAGVVGLGGVGKTRLASEVAHRYGRYFAGGVFWLSFAEAANVPSEVAACGGAEALALRPDFADLPQAEQVALVLRAWDEPLPRLLIFDNCEDEALLEAWLPRLGSGSRVLLTSRRATWHRGLSVQPLPLGTLPRGDSVALLAKFRPDLAGNEALDTIAEALGDLPLALHLAGSYLERYQHNKPLGDPAAYLRDLENTNPLTHPSLVGHGSPWNPTAHEQHVARTFALSTDRLAQSDAFIDHLALALLARAACFAPGEPIPRDLLLATLERPDKPELTLENEDALLQLVALGLAEQDEEGTLTLHRLLAHFAKESHHAPLLAGVESVVLNEARRLNHAGYPAAFRPLLPHLYHLTDAALPRPDEQAANLCNNLGYLLQSQGDYAAARPYYERALAIREQVLGPSHPNTATSLNNLGALLESQGEYAAARPYYERNLAICEQVLGPSHPDTALSLNNLGMLLKSQGEYAAARPYYERALAICEQVLGPSHPDTASSLNNLGYLLQSQGEYAAARPYLERTLAICEQVLGPSHPHTATSLNNLGMLLESQGEYAAARPYLERTLAIREQVLGPSHPDTALSLNNLGALLDSQGEYAAAHPYYERALAILEQVLGPSHPDTTLSLNNLGALLDRQGEYAAARPYLERTLAIREQVLGPSHPDTATSLNNLGALLYRQGEYAAARPYYERALAICEQVLGPSHPHTATSLNNLGMLLESQGEYAAARPYLERALAILEAALGPNHPNTRTVRDNLAQMPRQAFLGRGAKAARAGSEDENPRAVRKALLKRLTEEAKAERERDGSQDDEEGRGP